MFQISPHNQILDFFGHFDFCVSGENVSMFGAGLSEKQRVHSVPDFVDLGKTKKEKNIKI